MGHFLFKGGILCNCWKVSKSAAGGAFTMLEDRLILLCAYCTRSTNCIEHIGMCDALTLRSLSSWTCSTKVRDIGGERTVGNWLQWGLCMLQSFWRGLKRPTLTKWGAKTVQRHVRKCRTALKPDSWAWRASNLSNSFKNQTIYRLYSAYTAHGSGFRMGLAWARAKADELGNDVSVGPQGQQALFCLVKHQETLVWSQGWVVGSILVRFVGRLTASHRFVWLRSVRTAPGEALRSRAP